MSDKAPEEFVWEQLQDIFQLANNDATLETLEAIASHLGLQLNGMPVREFFHRRKREIAEHLVADFADTKPAFASQIKAAWEKLDREQER